MKRSGIKRGKGGLRWKRPRPESHRALRDELDSLFRQHILRRDGYVCVTSGEDDPQKLTCSHIFGRKNENARWHPLNAVCQSKLENEAHNHNKQPLFDYFISKYGKPMFDELYVKWNKAEKLSHIELVHLRDEYKAMVEADARAA